MLACQSPTPVAARTFAHPLLMPMDPLLRGCRGTSEVAGEASLVHPRPGSAHPSSCESRRMGSFPHDPPLKVSSCTHESLSRSASILSLPRPSSLNVRMLGV
jgi:hypothetical protein